MTRISLLVSAYRLGGLDITFRSVRNQSFKDFEFILVDSLYDYRRGVVQDAAKRLDIDDKLIYVRQSYRTYRASSEALNLGLRIARGELVVFWPHYGYATHNSLGDHWRIYFSSGCRRSSLGPEVFVSSPPLRESLKDVKVAPLENLGERYGDKYGYTIFEREFTEQDLRGLHRVVDERYLYSREQVYRKLGPEAPIDWKAWNFRNDSVPLQVCRDVGFLDERLDILNEKDFGLRANRSGHSFVWDQNNILYIVRPSHPLLSRLPPAHNTADVRYFLAKHPHLTFHPIKPSDYVLHFAVSIYRIGRMRRLARNPYVFKILLPILVLGRDDTLPRLSEQ